MLLGRLLGGRGASPQHMEEGSEDRNALPTTVGGAKAVGSDIEGVVLKWVQKLERA